MGLFALSRETFVERSAGLRARRLAPAPATGERNFLPFIAVGWRSAARVVTFPCTDPMEAIGINTPDELAAGRSAWLRARDR